MKPLPPPYVPGKTEAERFDNAVRTMSSCSKEDLTKGGEMETITARKKRTKQHS